MSWDEVLKKYKTRWWNHLVDEIMSDKKPRTSKEIQLLVKEGLYERRRTAKMLPTPTEIAYYLKIKDKYIKIDANASQGHSYYEKDIYIPQRWDNTVWQLVE